ncbi:hypothetical protein ACQKDV_19650, partial [Stenotrophomonas sp. NPDC077659]
PASRPAAAAARRPSPAAKEQLLDIVQEEPLAPIYVKSLAAGNTNAPLQFSSEFDDNDAANENE